MSVDGICALRHDWVWSEFCVCIAGVFWRFIKAFLSIVDLLTSQSTCYVTNDHYLLKFLHQVFLFQVKSILPTALSGTAPGDLSKGRIPGTGPNGTRLFLGVNE